jgi:hypothetical protein
MRWWSLEKLEGAWKGLAMDKQCEEMPQIDDSVIGLGFCCGVAAILMSSRVVYIEVDIEVLRYEY